MVGRRAAPLAAGLVLVGAACLAAWSGLFAAFAGPAAARGRLGAEPGACGARARAAWVQRHAARAARGESARAGGRSGRGSNRTAATPSVDPGRLTKAGVAYVPDDEEREWLEAVNAPHTPTGKDREWLDVLADPSEEFEDFPDPAAPAGVPAWDPEAAAEETDPEVAKEVAFMFENGKDFEELRLREWEEDEEVATLLDMFRDPAAARRAPDRIQVRDLFKMFEVLGYQRQDFVELMREKYDENGNALPPREIPAHDLAEAEEADEGGREFDAGAPPPPDRWSPASLRDLRAPGEGWRSRDPAVADAGPGRRAPSSWPRLQSDRRAADDQRRRGGERGAERWGDLEDEYDDEHEEEHYGRGKSGFGPRGYLREDFPGRRGSFDDPKERYDMREGYAGRRLRDRGSSDDRRRESGARSDGGLPDGGPNRGRSGKKSETRGSWLDEWEHLGGGGDERSGQDDAP